MPRIRPAAKNTPASRPPPTEEAASPRREPASSPACSHTDEQERRAHAVALVNQSLCDVVRSVIEQAKQGSYLHARFLFDFAGIGPPPPPPEARDDLLALLLRELGIEPPGPAAAATVE